MYADSDDDIVTTLRKNSGLCQQKWLLVWVVPPNAKEATMDGVVREGPEREWASHVNQYVQEEAPSRVCGLLNLLCHVLAQNVQPGTSTDDGRLGSDNALTIILLFERLCGNVQSTHPFSLCSC
jgi:hypothetical protein